MHSRCYVIAILLCAVLLMTTCSACRADLVSWWKADGNTLDAVGGNDGTAHSGLAYASGVKGQAFSFDGVNDGINVPDNTTLQITGSLTIDVWINLASYPSIAQGWAMVLFRGDDRGSNDPYFIGVDQDGKLSFVVTDASNDATYLSTEPIPLNRWTRVTATLSDATGLMRIYLDGQVVSETTTTIRPFRDLEPLSNPSIGIGNHGGYPISPVKYPFHGMIDDLKVYNSVQPPPYLLLQNQTDRTIARLSVGGSRILNSATILPTLPANWRVAAAADLDGDGWDDIVAQNTSTRAVAILFMKANRVKSSVGVNPTLPANWVVKAAGDIDSDGKPDLVVQNTATQQIAALLMDAAKITQSRSFSKSLAAGWSVVGAADFSGDGLTDLVVQNGSTRQISILTLSGPQITGSVAVTPTLPANWSVGAVGDYDGDGNPDLVAQNSTTGQISVLTVVDTKITGSYSLTPTAPAGWKLVGPK